jgi:hypothetical protein
MRTSAKGEVVLRPLAESLFRQMQMFGQMSLGGRTDPAKNTVLARRIEIISGYFWTLQRYAALELEGGEVLLYNVQLWPSDAPPAGWAEPGTSILPTHLLTSYSAFWIGSGCSDDERPSVRRLVKAAAWLLLQTNDLPRVTQYLFELLTNGVVLDPYDVAAALDIVLRGWRSVATEEELPQQLFTSDPPRTSDELFEANPRFQHDDPMRRPAPDALEAIVAFVDKEICGVRATLVYDDWLIKQVVLERVLRAAKAVLKRHAPPSLGLTALLDQYEEIYCDSGAIHLGASYSFDPYISTYTSAFVIMFEMQGLLERLRTERAMIPDAVADELLHFRALPPEWNAISPMLASVIATVVRDSDPEQLDYVRSRPFTPGELLASGKVVAYLSSLGITDMQVRVALVHDLMDRERPADVSSIDVNVTELPFDVEAEVLENGGQVKRQWLANRLLNAAALEEVRRLYDAAHSASPSERVELFEKAAALYPYFGLYKLELAIAYDELLHDPAGALPYIRDAILLNPAEPMYWHSLGVLCRRLSLPSEAVPAFAMATWLSSAERPDDDASECDFEEPAAT